MFVVRVVRQQLVEDEGAVINVHDVLEVVQRTLVLLGNANELISQTRRCAILKCVDHNLEKYGKDPPKNNGDLLFGKEFCAQLKSQVESDKALSQVVTLANRYQPYDKSRQSTLGRSREQFFRQSPVGKWGSRQGHTFSSSKQSQKPIPRHQPSGSTHNLLAKLGKS